MQMQEKILLSQESLYQMIRVFENAKTSAQANQLRAYYHDIIKEVPKPDSKYIYESNLTTLHAFIDFTNLFGYVYDEQGRRALMKEAYEIIGQIKNNLVIQGSHSFERLLPARDTLMDEGFISKNASFVPPANKLAVNKFETAASAVEAANLYKSPDLTTHFLFGMVKVMS
ncbi:MAG: hypothetical protein FWF97_04145 [Alphaproteobacteria bacterium]|nr:hypothetical protein [Alphaproteobacteria bacterium]